MEDRMCSTMYAIYLQLLLLHNTRMSSMALERVCITVQQCWTELRAPSVPHSPDPRACKSQESSLQRKGTFWSVLPLWPFSISNWRIHHITPCLPMSIHLTWKGIQTCSKQGGQVTQGIHTQAVFGNQGSEEQCKCSCPELDTQCYSPLVPKSIKPSTMHLEFERYSFLLKPKYLMNQSTP